MNRFLWVSLSLAGVLTLAVLALPACNSADRPVAPGTVAQSASSAPCTGILGSTAIDSTVGTSYGTSAFYAWVVPNSAKTLTNMSVYSTSSTPVTYELGIYSDLSGAPYNLLAQTGEQISGPVTGWNTAALQNSIALTSGVTYWLACHSTNLNLNSVSSGVTYYYQNSITTFGSLPAPAVPSRNTNFIFSYYGNICP